MLRLLLCDPGPYKSAPTLIYRERSLREAAQTGNRGYDNFGPGNRPQAGVGGKGRSGLVGAKRRGRHFLLGSVFCSTGLPLARRVRTERLYPSGICSSALSVISDSPTRL